MGSISPSERLLELGGIATRGTLLRSCERVDLDRAVTAGDVVRIARGRYALAVVDEDVRTTARLGGVLAMTSAVLHHGWAVKIVPDRPHLMFSRGRHIDNKERGAHVHRAELAPRTSRTVSPLQRSRWRTACGGCRSTRPWPSPTQHSAPVSPNPLSRRDRWTEVGRTPRAVPAPRQDASSGATVRERTRSGGPRRTNERSRSDRSHRRLSSRRPSGLRSFRRQMTGAEDLDGEPALGRLLLEGQADPFGQAA